LSTFEIVPQRTARPMTGRGFFNIDYPMVTSIMSAATTYIFVLIQFKMAEKNYAAW
jgi:hypothetical protein